MSATRTAPSKRSTAKANAAPTPDALQLQQDGLAILIALCANPTAESVATAESMVATDTDALRLSTFNGRVINSAMVGYTLKAKAILALGEVNGFAAAAAAVGVTHKGTETYLGRKFSTLEECWRIASHHTAERLESFVAAFNEAHGINPESVRAYSNWVNADAKGGKSAAKASVETLKARRDAAAKAKATADANAKAKANERTALVKAKATAKVDAIVIKGCPLTKAQWDAMDVATLAKVATLAEYMRSAKAKAEREAATAERQSAVDSETGPAAKAKPRTKVTA